MWKDVVQLILVGVACLCLLALFLPALAYIICELRDGMRDRLNRAAKTAPPVEIPAQIPPNGYYENLSQLRQQVATAKASNAGEPWLVGGTRYLDDRRENRFMFTCKQCKFECDFDDHVAGSYCYRCVYGITEMPKGLRRQLEVLLNSL